MTPTRHILKMLRLLMPLLLMAGVQSAWAQESFVVQDAAYEGGTNYQATDHVQLMFGSGTWTRSDASPRTGWAATTKTDARSNKMGNIPTQGNYWRLVPSVDGSMTVYTFFRSITDKKSIDVYDEDGVLVNKTVVNDPKADGSVSIDASATFEVTADKEYFVYSSGTGNMEFYGFTFSPKFAWSQSEVSVDITDVDLNNHADALLPVLINGAGKTGITYSSSNPTVASFWDAETTPRLKTTGVTVITATANDETAVSYTLTVTGTVVSGTYDSSTETFTFDSEGILSPRSAGVTGLTAQYSYGLSAVVVSDAVVGTAMKVIDTNGFSHANTGGGVVPPTNNWGGTFLRLTATRSGTLTVVGHFDTPQLYTEAGVAVPTSLSGTTLTASLTSGNTYYLYNGNGSALPLVHSFSYEVGSTVFKRWDFTNINTATLGADWTSQQYQKKPDNEEISLAEAAGLYFTTDNTNNRIWVEGDHLKVQRTTIRIPDVANNQKVVIRMRSQRGSPGQQASVTVTNALHNGYIPWMYYELPNGDATYEFIPDTETQTDVLFSITSHEAYIYTIELREIAIPTAVLLYPNPSFTGFEHAPQWSVFDDRGEDISAKFVNPYYETTTSGIIAIDDETGVATGTAAGDAEVKVTLYPNDTNYGVVTATTSYYVLGYPTVWDFKTNGSGISNGSGKLAGWTWDSHGYYESTKPDFEPVLKSDDTPLDVPRGLEFKGRIRYHATAGSGKIMMVLNGNGAVKIPVKQGMTLAITYTGEGDRTLPITNVLTLDEVPTSSFTMKNTGVAQTEYFITAADGEVVLTNNSNRNFYIEKIELYTKIIFSEGEEIWINLSRTGYANEILNADKFDSFSFSSSNSSVVTVDASGRLTPQAVGDAVITVNGRGSGLYSNITTPYTVHVVSDIYMCFVYTALDRSLDGNGIAAFDGQQVYWSEGANGRVPRYTVARKSDATGYTVECSITQGLGDADYDVTVKYPGVVTVTATYSAMQASYDVNVSGIFFGEPYVVRPRGTDAYSQTVATSGPVTYSVVRIIRNDVDVTAAERSKLTLTGAALSGINSVFGTGTGGCIEVSATDGSVTANYVLTIAYNTAEGSKTWDFFHDTSKPSPVKLVSTAEERENYYTDPYYYGGLANGVGGDIKDKTTGIDLHGNQWSRIYQVVPDNLRPRWAYDKAVEGDNGVIHYETAGLIFRAGAKKFTMRNRRTEDDPQNDICYTHVGLRQAGAQMIVPNLKRGDYVRIKTMRHSDNSGERMLVSNAKDLTGTDVTSQIVLLGAQHNNNPKKVDGTAGNMFHRIHLMDYGYYTFRAAADGPMTFTTDDNGVIDILEVKVYDGHGTDFTDLQYYEYDMLKPMVNDVGTMDNRVDAPVYILHEPGQTVKTTYTFCNQVGSTNTGPGDYEFDTSGPSISCENVLWREPYWLGEVTVGDWGKYRLRMRGYTGNRAYITSYTPWLYVNVGVAPHQDYPKTWDFTNVAGGALASDADNGKALMSADADITTTAFAMNGETAAKTKSTDGLNWTAAGTDRYQMKDVGATETETGSSYYVPGALLVADDNVIRETDGLGFDVSALSLDVSAAEQPMTMQGTITIPDVTRNMWIYVRSSRQPSAVVTDADDETTQHVAFVSSGSDAATGVYKYVMQNMEADETVDVLMTFDASTEVHQIGVTDKRKNLNFVSAFDATTSPLGGAWATESRDSVVDHQLTGYFTVNDVNAYVVPEYNYRSEEASVTLTDACEVTCVPANTGLLLWQKTATSALARVPLFVPAITTPVTVVGTNLLRPVWPTTSTGYADSEKRQLDTRLFTQEREDADGNDAADGNYTRFLFSNVFWTWTRDNLSNSAADFDGQFTNTDHPGFYRHHVFSPDEATAKGGGKTAEQLNTLDRNKAYLVLPTGEVPHAVWSGLPTLARNSLTLMWSDDDNTANAIENVDADNNSSFNRIDPTSDAIYNLQGQRITPDNMRRGQLYIYRGKLFRL